MGSMYKVAIVGRPNVGKSALFNRIARKRRAIVEDVEGVTRDRLVERVEAFGKTFSLIDTGGIDSTSSIEFSEEIRNQTMMAIEEADALVFVVDGTAQITLQDEEVAKMLFKTEKPVHLAVNKVDSQHSENMAAEFYAMGFDTPFFVSALHGRGVADLLEGVIAHIGDEQEEEIEQPKIAIVGRPNVGKSTLLNYLMNEERCLVSDIPGTTRDTIDIDMGGCTFIDTAGIRKKKAEKESVEKFAAVRTMDAIERCDVCVIMIDVNDGLTSHEKSIIAAVQEQGKGCILFVNKWDSVKEVRMEHVQETIMSRNHFLAKVPIIVGSAKQGRNVETLFPYIFEVFENLNKRITTGQLNNFLERAIQRNHPPMIKGKRLRIYYLTQATTNPPTFVLFVNYPELLTESYRRYLLNNFRDVYHFTGCPIRFKIKKKRNTKSREQLHSKT